MLKKSKVWKIVISWKKCWKDIDCLGFMVYKYKEDASSGVGLTLTWDVFKSIMFRAKFVFSTGLTLTWDVFKFVLGVWSFKVIEFNFNMRCI